MSRQASTWWLVRMVMTPSTGLWTVGSEPVLLRGWFPGPVIPGTCAASKIEMIPKQGKEFPRRKGRSKGDSVWPDTSYGPSPVYEGLRDEHAREKATEFSKSGNRVLFAHRWTQFHDLHSDTHFRRPLTRRKVPSKKASRPSPCQGAGPEFDFLSCMPVESAHIAFRFL